MVAYTFYEMIDTYTLRVRTEGSRSRLTHTELSG